MTRAKDISKIVTDANLSGTLDVTGTVTAGGLTVEKSAAVGATFNRLTSSGHTIDVQVVGNTVGSLGSDVGGQGMFNIDAVTAGVSSGKILLTTNDVRRQLIDNNGDISFYEDTGTTPKLFWDSSAERLGIGTASPDSFLSVYQNDSVVDGTGGVTIEQDGTGDARLRFLLTATQGYTLGIDNSDSDKFKIGTSDDLGANNLVTLTSDGKVGIGTSSPSANAIHAVGATSMGDGIILESQGTGDSEIEFRNTSSGNHTWAVGLDQSNSSAFAIGYANALGASLSTNNILTIDTSGNLLVGKTTVAIASEGAEVRPIGIVAAARDLTGSTGSVLYGNRIGTTDGPIQTLYKDGSTVGIIGVNNSDNLFISGNSTHAGLEFLTVSITPHKNGSLIDNTIDLGDASYRFDDVYATNGTIQTSDRNEKQDIEQLSDAEQRVAVVAKGLMRKFRWIDSVAEKGDNARTHFGIIAQDLQDAFTAEGLDASDYAMFTSNTWWEKEISVDAVEADEENGIEAQDAYTYMDTKEEATEGYTERTRLGVRYNQLLAFIISAI